MDKLEHYLDQVCRRIGGPKLMRRHVRQELREHLLDAAAEHRAKGLSEENALARALDDFGGPEQVRSELEATHGHRLMAVVVDKAMQWKESTMKARWLWTTWAHLSLASVIAVEVLFIVSAFIFIVPRYVMLLDQGLIDAERAETHDLVSRTVACLRGMDEVVDFWFVYFVPLAVAWGMFEWRVRSENKAFMRLSALGMAAVALMVVVLLTASALVIPMTVAVTTMNERVPEPIVDGQLAKIEVSIDNLRKAMERHDLEAARQHGSRAWAEMDRLARMGAAAPVLISRREQAKVDELRALLNSANKHLGEARVALSRRVGHHIPKEEETRFEAAMQEFNDEYGQVKAVAKTEN